MKCLLNKKSRNELDVIYDRRLKFVPHASYILKYFYFKKKNNALLFLPGENLTVSKGRT